MTQTVSDEHKAALAEGREQSKAIREYLEALQAHKPKRGRKRTPDNIQKRLAAITDEEKEAPPLARLQLVQERMDLEAELATMTNGTTVDMDALQKRFVAAAGPYSARKGITWQAWRHLDVDAAVLKEAGVPR